MFFLLFNKCECFWNFDNGPKNIVILMMEISIWAVVFAVLELGFLGARCEKPSVVKIGGVFSFDSVIGKGAKLAMEMAVEEVNSDPRVLNGTMLEMVMEDLDCNVFVGPLKAMQVIEKGAMAIIGPQSSAIARIVADVGKGLQVPVLSYAATNPALSSLQFPYFLRTGPSDTNQMTAIADIIDFYEWKEIIAVFVDNEYGQNAISALADELSKRMSKISYRLAVSPLSNLSDTADILNKSRSYGPRVYVVHIDPDPRLKFFRIAKKLNMITSNYVWLATDWLSSTLDSLPEDRGFVKSLQGIVTLRPHIPHMLKRKAFNSRWQRVQQKNSLHSNYTAYGLYAYDTVWLTARSIDRFLQERGCATFSFRNESMKLRNLRVFDGGKFLRKLILNSSFTGLTGQVQFDSDRNRVSIGYEIINVVHGPSHTVGYWSNNTGLSVQSPDSLKNRKFTSSRNGQKLNNITWPGGEVKTPRGWVIATKGKPLKIGYPKRVSFSEFVTDLNQSNTIHGYCIDLFAQVLKLIPYDVPFIYEPFGEGLKNPNYDEFVRMVAEDVFDAAIGDVAIVANRIKIVDFTQPFATTGLVVVAQISKATSGWVFIRPFTVEMWCAIGASFIVIAVVIWMLEHKVNDAFRGPPRQQLKTMFLFSFSTLFRGHREKTISSLGRVVMVVWLFLLLVVTSSYTASLSSILTIQQLPNSIRGIDDLVSSGYPVGYQVGSFARNYMINSLNVHPSRLISLGSPEEFEAALRKGPLNGGVAAIVDEIPYVELFLSDRTDFGIMGQPFTKSGWGFAFQKGSPFAMDVSTAMLKLFENGELEKLHRKWFCEKGCPDERSKRSESSKLNLSSFGVLYSICASFALIALSVFLTRAIRQYVRYKRQQTNPSSAVLSRAIRNFFEFVDEKEDTV